MRTTRDRAAGGMTLLAASLFTLSGCLGTPPIEESWTMMEIAESNVGSGVVNEGAVSVSMKGRITFREILTGSVVADIRHSASIAPGDLEIDAENPSLSSAQQIDLILQNSTSTGFTSVLVTGFDHLVRGMDFQFDASIPAMGDSLGGSTFLLVYFADVEEIELESGQDSIVVIPILTTDEKVLASGIELRTPASLQE